MANEFTKDTKIRAAVNGTIANADEYNRNIAGQSKGSILPIDVDGEFADGDIGNETIVTDGALAKDIKVRTGFAIKVYDAFGVLVNTLDYTDLVNLQTATTTQEGTGEIATNGEVAAGAETGAFFLNPANLLSLFGASSQAATPGFIRIPINIGGSFDEIILQWGSNNVTGPGTLLVNLPVAFPNAALKAVSALFNTNTGRSGGGNIGTISTTQVQLVNGNGNLNDTISWFIIGF